MAGRDPTKPGYPIVTVATNGFDNKGLAPQFQQKKSWAARNKWLITGVAVLVVAAIAISVSVTTISRSNSKKAAVTAPTPTVSAETDASSVLELPPPDQFDEKEWAGVIVEYYKRLNDSQKLTPDNIRNFISEARVFLKDRFNVTLPDSLGSPKTILQYLQATQQWDVIQAIVQWADGKDLTTLRFDDLVNLVNQLQAAFNLDRIYDFNKAMSVAHEYVTSRMERTDSEEMTFTDLLDGLAAQGYDMSEQEQLLPPEKQVARRSSPKKKSSPPRKASPRKGTPSPPRRKSPTPKASIKKSPPKSPTPGHNPNVPVPKTPFTFLPTTIPLVFHVLKYIESSASTGGKSAALPPTDDAQAAATSLVKEVNRIFRAYNTKIQFRVGEVRSNHRTHPYLLLKSKEEWQTVAADGLQIKGRGWLEANNRPVDQFVNVYVAGSFGLVTTPCMSSDQTTECGRGYAWVAPITTCAATESQKWQHTFIMFDEFSPAFYNKDWGGYVPGAIVMAHELAHHLGLQHTHKGPNKAPYGCNPQNDDISDTPQNDDAQQQDWWQTADALCDEVLRGKKVNWAALAKKFDSCPSAQGVDAVNNIMSYAPDTCRNINNMGITRGQVAYMQMKTIQCRPRLYGCGSGAMKNCYGSG